jgi:cytochrome oxidase Cu insertion factor (SCO1/SenC/PrrC family)
VTANRRAALVSLMSLMSLALPVAAQSESSAFRANFDGALLVDQEGRPFSFAPLAGKVLLVNFVYTGCSAACPVQTRALAQVQAALSPDAGSRVRFVSVTLDPLQDTPSALKAFAKAMGADLARWSFVTGRQADIDRIAQRLRVLRTGSGAKMLEDHTTSLWAVDANGRLVQRYAGNPPDHARLVRELTELARISK